MEWFISITAMVASVVAAFYAVRNDKAHIKSRIRKKEHKINELENLKFRKYHNKFIGGTITPEDEKIAKLKQEIANLEDRL